MSEETVWQGLAAILPIFHWTVLVLDENLPRGVGIDSRRTIEDKRGRGRFDSAICCIKPKHSMDDGSCTVAACLFIHIVRQDDIQGS